MTVFPQGPFFILYKKVQVKLADIGFSMSAKVGYGQLLDSSKLKEFADDTFRFDENGGKFSKRVENTAVKGEIAPDVQFLLFP